MLNQCKILPIHAEVASKGKLVHLNDKIKRNYSLHAHQASYLQAELPIKNRNRAKTGYQLSRTHHSYINTPPQFITDFPPPSFSRKKQMMTMRRNRSVPVKKDVYLPRKMLQKQMLQQYLHNLFKKVVFARGVQEKNLHPVSKNSRTKSTISVV